VEDVLAVNVGRQVPISHDLSLSKSHIYADSASEAMSSLISLC